MILSIVQFVYPEYVVYSWYKYLLYVAVIVAASLLNIFGSQILPTFNRCICKVSHPSVHPFAWILISGAEVAFSLATYLVTMITMLVCSYPNYNSAKWVFTDTTISTGWTSHPYTWTLCFVNSLYGFLGTDSGAHMAEEIPNPSINGPKVIVGCLWNRPVSLQL
jgi:choline transport protein